MEFLVQISVELPAELAPESRARLREEELARGRELREAGVIRAIWRVPGGLRNVGIWEAEDATALHEAIESLPLFPWLVAEVTPLAEHPIDRSEG